MIDKKEFKYIILSGLFALIWFSLILPRVIDKVNGNIMQFFLFNVGLIVFLQIFLKSFVSNTRITGAIGLVLMIVAIDVFTPPYLVTQQGELLTGAILYSSSPDYFIGSIGQSLGINGFLLYLFTYVLAPIFLLFASAKLIPNFIRNI